jgi:C4-dicarboxylate transporter DctM subunit
MQNGLTSLKGIGLVTWGSMNSFTLVQVCGNLLFIIYAAYIYAYAIGVAGVGESVASWLVGLHLSHFEFFAPLFVLSTVLGCLVESIGMIVITVPLLYPVLGSYGIDPI